ncbi:RidA family protein [Nesterenkonia ebinurensis]|uniref:RidA family protein n=1 Tax=Nesterenkonia ebinurensis TaxID=2608252 RepID=UPI00123CB36F|nr:Rid family detoxifying hydrolase [Nesterenkonia ebinurensis]
MTGMKSAAEVNIVQYSPADRRSPKGAYSVAIGKDSLVFVSGQVGTRPETGELAGEDVAEQTRQTMNNIQSALQAAELRMESIVKTTVYITRPEDLGEMDAAYREFFTGIFPARSAVTVAALARPDFLVEIDAIATR